MESPDYFNIVKILLKNSYMLFIVLSIISVVFLCLAYYLNKNNNLFLSSIFTSLFVAFLQIIITVFIIEKFLEQYQENQWYKTKLLINQMIESEIKDDLAEIISFLDFSKFSKPSKKLELQFEKSLHLNKQDVLNGAHELLKSLKLDDFADHHRYKKGDDIFDYQISVLKDFNTYMKDRVQNLDKIIQFAQINIDSETYNELIDCRKEYLAALNNINLYVQFLEASEITGELIDYNLKFETKYKEEMYKSILIIINLSIDLLNKN